VKQLVVASTNPGKIREVGAALTGLTGWSVQALPPGQPEIEETGASFIENAVLKAVHYSQTMEGFLVADDSGLCVDALDGRPGIHSARYGRSAGARNARLLSELAAAGAQKESDRTATFYCALAVARLGNVVWTVQCELHGWIPLEPAGAMGFGYDSVFVVSGLNKTLAELTTEEKNRISARGQALAALHRFLSLPVQSLPA
jgi:XTP/dITP diphosphohydrolase